MSALSTATTPTRSIVHALIRVAIPASLSRLGFVLITATDIVMLGHTSNEAVAAYALAHAVFIVAVVALIGSQMGVMILTSQALGQGRMHACGPVFFQSLPIGLLWSTGALLIALPLYAVVGVNTSDAAVGAAAQRVYVILLLALPSVAVVSASTFFLEGLRRPVQVTIIMLGANVLNGVLNIPALEAWGPEGVAWVSTGLRWSIAVVFVAVILLQSDRRKLGLTWACRPRFRGFWSDSQRLRRLGRWVALPYTIESVSLAVVFFLLAALPTRQYALLGMGHNLVTFVMVGFIGIAVSASVGSGVATGRRKVREVRTTGIVALLLCLIANVLFSGGMLLWPYHVARLYSTDAVVVEGFVALSPWLCAGVAAWSGQILIAQALRGVGEARGPAWINAICYTLILIPLGVVLGFQRGPQGVFEAEVLASVVAIAALMRLWVRAIRRPSTYD